jgi:hypothetical protein
MKIRYFRTSDSFWIKDFKEVDIRIGFDELLSVLSKKRKEQVVESGGSCGSGVCLGSYVLNAKVVREVIRQEHRYRLDRVDSPWVELSLRKSKVGSGCGRPALNVHGGVCKADYEEACANVLVALKYKDEAWFVEYCKRIWLYERRGHEWNNNIINKVLDYFRNVRV